MMFPGPEAPCGAKLSGEATSQASFTLEWVVPDRSSPAHGRDVEHGGRVRLRAFGPADRGAEELRRRLLRLDRMVQPLIMIAIDVVMAAEGPRVELLLGALIDERALVAREGCAIFFRLEEILA